MQNSKDMKKRRITLSAYYGELKHKNPAKEFITEVCQKCDVTKQSVYKWMKGEIIPDKLKREAILKIVRKDYPQITENELFNI
ncbi:MAG: hypothetical protein GYA16_15590 [Spirochaetes bacterium]|nr:hypothetical protein [Spirochaetota bacterium]